MRHRLVSLLGFFILGAALAGCGGGTSAPATATTITPTSATTNVPAATVSATRPATAPAAATVAAPATTAPSVAATSPAASAPVVPATAVASAGDGKTVAVELKDYAITLSTSTVSAGMVTFNVKNSGPSAHNFNVMSNGEEKGVMTLDPGTTATLMLNLTAGSYDFRCNIPGHNLLGMKGTLTVK
jgi:uncharacterized cupredoxin-like copper-binding protein